MPDPSEDPTKPIEPETVADSGQAETPPDDPTVSSSEFAADPLVGVQIRYLGDYELMNVIGRGGMGVVYRAKQISLNRLVAVKVIRFGETSSDAELRRFQHEAEAIAALDHPGIVPIYEIGTHEGRHYFSMKLIQGESLAKAIPRLKGNYRAIGRILADSARAVQHAHARGILHRDIKPANIVLDGEDIPHVTDFGLAKRLEAESVDPTLSAAIVGTPAYMAPEQTTASRGSITIATDIYGLGAVLYAMLSGHAPHRGSSVLEVLDAVREKQPEPPSRDDPKIPRDLEVICMKCMDREPGRRYQTAGELADDLDRWLEDRPISARKVSGVARFILWCKRRPLVAGLAAALLISVLAGSAGVLINWQKVRRQRDEINLAYLQVRAESQASRSLNDFLVSDLLAFSSPFLAGARDVPVSTLLDRSAEYASTRFANQPKIEASIRQILGVAYLSLGMIDKSEAELLRSTKIRQSLPESDEADRLSSEYFVGYLRLFQNDFEQAEIHARNAFDGRRKLLGETDEATLEAASLLGAVVKMRGRADEARNVLEKAIATAREVLGDEHRMTRHLLTNLAVVTHDQGRYQEAFTTFDQIARISLRINGANHPETLLAQSRLGATLFFLGRLKDAEEVLLVVVESARDVLGPRNPETIRIMNNLAAVQCMLGKNEAAATQFRKIIEQLKEMFPPDHQQIMNTELNLSVALLRQKKTVEAELILRDLVPKTELSG